MLCDIGNPPTALINALGYRTTNIFDTGGRGVATVNAKGNRNTTVYDPKGRPAASVNPLGKRWSTIYNAVGQTAASKDPLGNRSTSVFDTAGRVFASINPLGKRTTTIYNIASQSLATVDANGNRVSSVYDALGRRTVEINALGNRTTTIFNSVGQNSALVDARGNRHSFTYDSTGAQTQLIDPLNRRTTSAYDAAGQQNVRIDARGNRTTFAYSTVGQLTSRKYPDGTRASFSYDTVGNRTLMADSTGRYTSTYDAVGQTSFTASPNNQRQTFSYDAVGQRRSMDAAGAGRFTYQYDAASQLSSLLNPYSERTTFAYDPAGNRTLKNVDGARTTYAYDNANQLKYGQAVAGRTTYSYDLTGNQRIEQPPAGNRTTTTWNYENQPTQYLLPAGSPVTMSYNGDNRRVISQQGATSTKLVWDTPTDAYLTELNAANAVQAVYTNEPRHYGSVVSQRRATTSRWLHADALGSTRFLTDNSGSVTDTYLNDAWGNQVASMGTTVNPFKWVGENGYYTDDSTGQVYVRARMYQPTVARWCSVDPISPIHDTYRYGTGSPAMRHDASGLLDCYCKGRCDLSGAGFQQTLNSFINSELIRIFSLHPFFQNINCPLSEEASVDLRITVRNWFATNVENGYGGDLPVTWIEQELHTRYLGITPDGLSEGPPKVGILELGFFATSDCMPIKRNGKSLCIGTDKIGHFFQQGYMGYEMNKAGLDDWVRAFFQMTEGLPVTPTPNSQKLVNGKYMHFHEWFNTSLYFMGFGVRRPSYYFRRWGGLFEGLTQSSHADLEANLAGAKFYENLPDLCCCLSWYAQGNVGPLPANKPCFDICTYLTEKWEE